MDRREGRRHGGRDPGRGGEARRDGIQQRVAREIGDVAQPDVVAGSRQERGEPWTNGLVIKASTLDTQRYFNPEDRSRFDADYAFLESMIREPA